MDGIVEFLIETIKEPTVMVTCILLTLTESITIFDIRILQAKRVGNLPADHPEFPRWINIFHWLEWVLRIVLLIFNWKFALFFFVILFILKVLPVLETIGNVLMAPFKSSMKKPQQVLGDGSASDFKGWSSLYSKQNELVSDAEKYIDQFSLGRRKQEGESNDLVKDRALLSLLLSFDPVDGDDPEKLESIIEDFSDAIAQGEAEIAFDQLSKLHPSATPIELMDIAKSYVEEHALGTAKCRNEPLETIRKRALLTIAKLGAENAKQLIRDKIESFKPS